MRAPTASFVPPPDRTAVSARPAPLRIAEGPAPHRHFVFTIPRVLRGLFQRDRRLLSLLPRCAFRALRLLYQAHFARRDALPGAVIAIQTFGSSLAFHPHLHALVSDGMLTRDGAFLPLLAPDLDALEELFRRLLIHALRKARRLSEDFARRLLAWRHSGFSVYARQLVLSHQEDRLDHLARYLTRPPLAGPRLQTAPDGTFRLPIPPDPRTGATQLSFQPLDLIHALTLQIPDRGQHLVRYYGAYANRVRDRYRLRDDPRPTAQRPADPALSHDEDSAFVNSRRRSWARLLRKILEVEPLLCPRCNVEMTIVSVLTDPPVVDAILRHLQRGAGHDPFQPRAPPAA